MFVEKKLDASGMFTQYFKTEKVLFIHFIQLKQMFRGEAMEFGREASPLSPHQFHYIGISIMQQLAT